MRAHRSQSSRRLRLAGAVALVGIVALTACDTGDGTTLRTPTAPTTLPAPEVAPLPSEPLGEPGGSIDGVPVSELPPPEGRAVDGADAAGLQVFAPWADAGSIDIRYTCDGSNAAPAISWAGTPVGTVEMAVALVDESDLSAGRPFVHWVMSGIAPEPGRIGGNEVPDGAIQGLNFFGDVGYAGPCPDPGTTHTYVLSVFALGQQLELADGTPAAELLDAIGSVAIETARSSGWSSR